ncbi:hypothetical protein PTTG_26066 [Puccinia triticina 1-1 BBBD Race 1]|uniref:NAM-associated domain-containing protein n=1 Tax=Puccinia triticina (isolate 1-1 / race 1 (BBBD)) TaxID=630390 RepID=A0A180GYN2_PUCT1|nr:hypothetical protein PTTG_26066 [Puccinia triticina 1-1 BBBD Race 1]
MDNIPLDPALEALMPSTDDLMEIDVLSAPQNESRKRSIPLPDVAGPNPKNSRKKTVKPRPKKAVKKKNQEPPEPPNKMPPIEEDHPPASVEANKPNSGDSSESEPDGDNPPKKKKAPNYLEHKDLQLCNSWLETTKDSRKGTDQSGTAFWETITNHYQSKISEPLQPLKSIKSHFGIIQHAVNKFHGCVNQINHRNPSGTTATNRISMALTLYTKLYEKPFQYISCYNLLSKAPKWIDYNAAMNKKAELKKPEKVSGPSSKVNTSVFSPLPGSLPSSTPAETAQLSSEASGDETARTGPTRPIGRKKAKLAYQEEKLDASNHEHLKKMAGAHVEIAEVVKKQQLLLQNAMSAQQKTLDCLADEAIMNKDLTGADEDVKRYYSLERKWILAQREQEIATPAPAQGPTRASSAAVIPACGSPSPLRCCTCAV